MPWIVGGSVVSGALGANAADEAADDAANAAANALAIQTAQGRQVRHDTALGRSVGKGALYELAGTFGIGVPDQAKLNEYDRKRSTYLDRIARAEQGQGIPGEQDLKDAGFANVDEWLNSLKVKLKDVDGRIQAMSRPTGAGSGTRNLYGNLEMDPGYQFRLGENEKALQRMQSAGGTRYGGGALKAAMRYGQDYASGEFSNAVNRRNSELGYLFSLAGFGESGIATASNAGANAANNSSNILMQNAQMQGNAAMTGASAINSAVQGGIQNYYTQSLLRDYNRRPQTSGPSSGTATDWNYNY
jgi:hypothetical protein